MPRAAPTALADGHDTVLVPDAGVAVAVDAGAETVVRGPGRAAGRRRGRCRAAAGCDGDRAEQSDTGGDAQPLTRGMRRKSCDGCLKSHIRTVSGHSRSRLARRTGGRARGTRPRRARVPVEYSVAAMRIAITGGTGFIGSHLASHLAEQGHELVLISRGARASGAARARGHAGPRRRRERVRAGGGVRRLRRRGQPGRGHRREARADLRRGQPPGRRQRRPRRRGGRGRAPGPAERHRSRSGPALRVPGQQVVG